MLIFSYYQCHQTMHGKPLEVFSSESRRSRYYRLKYFVVSSRKSVTKFENNVKYFLLQLSFEQSNPIKLKLVIRTPTPVRQVDYHRPSVNAHRSLRGDSGPV